MDLFKRLLWMSFLAALMAAGVGAVFLVKNGTRLDAESKKAAEEAVRAVAKNWSVEDADAVSDEVLKDIVAKNREKIGKLLGTFKEKLGSLKEIKESKGDANIFYDMKKGKRVSAHYVIEADFEKAKARITLTLSRPEQTWLLREFRLDSDALEIR